MKKISLLTLTFILVIINAFGQELKMDSPRVFRLGADVGFAQVGYMEAKTDHSTQFLQVQLSPDYRFCKHFGVRLDLGWGRSIWTNLGGDATLHPAFTSQQVTAFLAPYFEWDFGKCYLAIAAGANFRIRFLQWGGYGFKPLTTCAVGCGLQPRVGIHLPHNWDLNVSARFEGHFYDPMKHAVSQSGEKRLNGALFINVGACYVFGGKVER